MVSSPRDCQRPPGSANLAARVDGTLPVSSAQASGGRGGGASGEGPLEGGASGREGPGRDPHHDLKKCLGGAAAGGARALESSGTQPGAAVRRPEQEGAGGRAQERVRMVPALPRTCCGTRARPPRGRVPGGAGIGRARCPAVPRWLQGGGGVPGSGRVTRSAAAAEVVGTPVPGARRRGSMVVACGLLLPSCREMLPHPVRPLEKLFPRRNQYSGWRCFWDYWVV